MRESALAAPMGESARITAGAAAAMRAAIALAGGREVCFVGAVDEAGVVITARAVARGDAQCVLALPGVAARGEMLLHNHPSGELEPSHADLRVAAALHEEGVGFGIVDSSVTRLYVVVEVPRAHVARPIEPEAMEQALGPDGVISRRLPNYEDRPSQRAMANAIAALYNRGGVGLFEAGTGVGKSLGYLVPSLRWAAANGERTVVSTNTINLQEQLVGKDLPFLANALGDQPVRYALLKGWRNYLCQQRLEHATSAGAGLFEEGVSAEVERIRGWAASTRDGSLADLPFAPRAEVWDEVAAEPDLCARSACPFFDSCFVFEARRRAAEADVIVVNHHLLLSDVAVRRASGNWSDAAVLPTYKRLVVDEGHHLEEAAAAHLGSTVTRRGVQRLFNRLDRRGRGLLPALALRLAEANDLLGTASLDLLHARLAPATHSARERATIVFDLLDAVLAAAGEPVLRLTAPFAEHPVWAAGLDAALDDLMRDITLLDDGLRLIRERFEADAARGDALAPLLQEMRGVARRLESVGVGLHRALRGPAAEPDTGGPLVRWIEVRGRDRNVAATAVPLDIAPILREDLFGRLETTVVTSATLASGGSFDFLSGRLGLDTPDLVPESDIFPSPFDYPRQALLCVPTNFPAPNVNAAAHRSSVMSALLELARASDGGIFALFTSHADVRAAAAELRASDSGHRWPLLVHGEDGRDVLLQRFRESGRAVLLGTASFWEGVDVSGQALRGLLIARLPFRVPTEPITAAHCEAIRERGGDPFAEYMLPHASLRLKQGFGRLIRSATDRGAVVLCDSRAVHKPYGRELLAALPPARRLVAAWSDIASSLRTFYAHDRPNPEYATPEYATP